MKKSLNKNNNQALAVLMMTNNTKITSYTQTYLPFKLTHLHPKHHENITSHSQQNGKI